MGAGTSKKKKSWIAIDARFAHPLRKRAKADQKDELNAAKEQLETLQDQSRPHPSLQAYFLSRAYTEGTPCIVDGYSENFVPLGDSQTAVLQHENTGIQIWQFALDLRIRNNAVIVREIFDTRDADGSGLLDRKELKNAMQALGFNMTKDEMVAYTKHYGGYHRARISFEDFSILVDRKYDDQVCLFVYTNEQGLRSVAGPGFKTSQIWTVLANDDNSELGAGLHACSKAPDAWFTQAELIINNRWPDHTTARKWGGHVAAAHYSRDNEDLCAHILRNAPQGIVSFCIPVLCHRQAASDGRDHLGEGRNVWGEELQPWRDIWLIDLAWGGLDPRRDQITTGTAGFLSASPVVDSLARSLSARITWRDAKFGYEDPLTASFLHYLASLRMARGRLDLAGPLLRRAFVALQSSLGWEDAYTLAAGTSLALFLDRCGEGEEAEHLFRYVLAIRTKKLGAEHPETLSSIGNLALLLHKIGDREESRKWLAHVLHLCEVAVEERRADAKACVISAGPLLIKGGQRKAHDQLVRQVQDMELERLLAHEQEKLRALTRKVEHLVGPPQAKDQHGRKSTGQQQASSVPQTRKAGSRRTGSTRSSRQSSASFEDSGPGSDLRRAGRDEQQGDGQLLQSELSDKISVHKPDFSEAELRFITQGVEMTTIQNSPELPLNRM